MKKILFAILMVLATMVVEGQTYSSLWKKANQAEQKELPRTQYNVLMKIVNKAQTDGQYGQLMAAELAGSRVMESISPDSLQPALDRMIARYMTAKDKALKAVYGAVLKRIYSDNGMKMHPDVKVTLDAETCDLLAKKRASDYAPLTVQGVDSKWFGHDMLSVVGYETGQYDVLHNYYEKAGNRVATLMSALKMLERIPITSDEDYGLSERLHLLDSLIHRYQDLPEVAEAVIMRAKYMQNNTRATVKEQWDYLTMALDRWGNYPRMNQLRNSRQQLQQPTFCATVLRHQWAPDREQQMDLKNLRNISQVTLRIYRADIFGNHSFDMDDRSDFKKLEPKLKELPQCRVERRYEEHECYEQFKDSFMIPALPVGIYVLEMTSPGLPVSRQLYYVSHLRLIREPQPDGGMRLVVVDAQEGQPMADAKIEVLRYDRNKFQLVTVLQVNAQGEAFYKTPNEGRSDYYFAYTKGDKALRVVHGYGEYSFYDTPRSSTQTNLFTDRKIYRPGQTVHVAGLHYEVTNGIDHRVLAEKSLHLTLRDANYQEVAQQTVVTDEYGAYSADFTLPASGLTGEFSIQTTGAGVYFSVEEYKRPTFEVTFEPYDKVYQDGDTVTVKGTARSYAGVPVANAKVSYEVLRRAAFWWMRYSSYYGMGYFGDAVNEQVLDDGMVVTAADGTFEVKMPLLLPKTKFPAFFNFVVEATVTDQAGESHGGTLSLPLGNRKTALGCDLPSMHNRDEELNVTFHLLNAAGRDVDAQVHYQIDKGKWETVRSNAPLALPKVAVGRHQLTAICAGDTLKKEWIAFSWDDRRPVVDTDDWFVQSDSHFPNDGKPVTVQVGASAPNMHIVYSIFAGKRLLEQGAVERSNELINRQFTYKEEYGDGLLMTFAWVKNDRCYHHEMHIVRPLPDKRLKLKWNTFRNLLKSGQQEEWTLSVLTPEGKAADAMLMATLYDKSLDQINQHGWYFTPVTHLSLPYTSWHVSPWHDIDMGGSKQLSFLKVPEIRFTHFNDHLFPNLGHGEVLMRRTSARSNGVFASNVFMVLDEDVKKNKPVSLQLQEVAVQKQAVPAADMKEIENLDAKNTDASVQMRENLNETAFFYPQLTTNERGEVALKFTLPESLTTWRFMGLAHTKDLCYGLLEDEAVAKKDLMVQPNMPRFVREGDEATVVARVANTADHDIQGKATLTLLNPENEQVIYTQAVPFAVEKGLTVIIPFALSSLTADLSPLICRVVAVADGASDGEQHYLPVLPLRERVTVTMPFTQHEPGVTTVDLTRLFSQPSSGVVTSPAEHVLPSTLTVEYTNNPAWLMVMALPTIGHPHDDCAICQATSLYAHLLGKHLLDRVPQAKQTFGLWKQEERQGNATSLLSNLQKNEELKDLVLNETPWVNDAHREAEQKQRLADFFDANNLQQRLTSAVSKLQHLQRDDGSWSWWPDMPGSVLMTTVVMETLVRLNTMVGEQQETKQMLRNAFGYMGKEMVRTVAEMKREEKKGQPQMFPSRMALEWLYLCKLDGRQLPKEVVQANAYLTRLLKKDAKNQTIYEKALTAVILDSRLYIRSLKEYTVFTEEMGRYYDAPRAGYSWRDYCIPTQVAAIEAIQRLTPEDRQTLDEMRRWLLQQKRTQVWDTPLNSVDAVYAFMNGGEKENVGQLFAPASPTVLAVDGKPLETSKATAGIGYVKTAQPYQGEKTFTAEKTGRGTSWGAVYAQFMQAAGNVKEQGNGVSVKREIVKEKPESPLRVGDKVKVRLTIVSERNLDFVQVQDKRAACMEPVSQISGYNWLGGYYSTPRDNVTNYYFDLLPKGKHVIETEYYIDREGIYETGTCSVQCAYVSEYRGVAPSVRLNVHANE